MSQPPVRICREWSSMLPTPLNGCKLHPHLTPDPPSSPAVLYFCTINIIKSKSKSKINAWWMHIIEIHLGFIIIIAAFKPSPFLVELQRQWDQFAKLENLIIVTSKTANITIPVNCQRGLLSLSSCSCCIIGLYFYYLPCGYLENLIANGTGQWFLFIGTKLFEVSKSK